MKTKKNIDLDPSRNQNLYFSMGVAVAAIMAYAFLELQSTKDVIIDKCVFNIPLSMDEPLLVLPPKQVELPKPKSLSQTLTVVPDPIVDPEPSHQTDDPIVKDAQIDPTTAIASSQTILYVPPPVDVDPIPFLLIEDVPIFPGCEKVSKDERKNCFQDMLHIFIKKNLRYPQAAERSGVEGRVYVSFLINQEGLVSVYAIRGPDKSLETEAKRIIEKLPKMTPGKQRNKPVKMSMAIPIVFKL